MIRAVLDANVLVSAILSPAGVPGQILDELRRGRFALVVSVPILDEIARVLEYPRIARLHRWARARIREFVSELAYSAIVTSGELRLRVVHADPADNRYLECAVEGDADYVVSGDQDLLAVEAYQGIRILGPRAFLQVLRARRPEEPR